MPALVSLGVAPQAAHMFMFYYAVLAEDQFGDGEVLKGPVGETNVLRDRPRRPLTRRVLLRAMELYGQRFSGPDGKVVATFEIITVTGWAPHESQQKPLKPGSAKMRLADALGTVERKAPR